MHGETRRTGRGGRRAGGYRAMAAAAALVALLGGCGGGTAAPAATASGIAAHAPQGAAGAPAAGALPGPEVWRRWGLRPLPAPPAPPAVKPVTLAATGPVPVISRIPTTDRVVFITIDDGAEKDPAFVRMMRDLKVPITMFLMDDAIRTDYGYFRPLQELGDHIQNHTLHHPVMSALPLARQKQEVCGDQQVLTREYGTAPLLFRPPYGAWNAGTRAAVGACGPRAIVLWRETMQIGNLKYQTADHALRPGDIILAHFRGPAELKGETMTAMFAHLLRHIQEQGFAVARLEDYLQAP